MDHWVLWGKTRQGQATGDETHALIHHMVDVGAVASVLWDRVVAEALREDLCQAAGLECQEMGRVLAWLASLHDLGKASPAFQSRYRAAIPALQAAGLRLEPQAQHVMHHSAIGHAVLAEELPALLGAPPPVTRGLAAVIGGHHGTWRSAAPDVPYWELGDEDWAPLRRELVEALTDLFRAPHPPRWPADQREVNALLAVLAGLITMADWVGSTDAFPCQRGPSDLAEYLAGALGRAREAAERLLPARLASGEAVPFEQMFPFPPNAVQEAAIELAAHLEGPALVIVEAPTGSGKSEAALYLAEQLQARLGGAGTYVAMPTVTTSNQMHERVTAALSAAHPQLPLHPLLVHGQALWQRPPPAVTAEEGGPAAAVDPMAWFLPRKRSLLAPYGVGTVDQALLSVLPTSHFYLRLCGLARKTVIFDEVHAYDTYMSALFERLLAWLHALGSSVIILSATLPASTRRRLLEAFGSSPGIVPAEPCACPAISWRSGQRAGVRPLRADDLRRQVYLRWVGRDCVLADLKAALAQGGCAAVICNTVARAQEAYLGLKEARLVPPEELYLFHARYPQAWRDGIEARVLERFGKTRRRRGDERAILVATQVVEQSLDLDFDYMATDLAPVDLLIQRA
ncbi:MAG: CRISPR-associated helicase Cas3', partial [Anaerolineae bacterium]|nr:CRISPR-associated helicase Cas3' [Anaerolineae bacterium]